MALRQAERTAAARTGAKTRAKKGIAAAPEILRPAKVRLQKALAAAGVTSRRKAEELIAAGAIKVNGKRVTELGTKVDPDRDAIEVRGSRVQLEKKVYFLLNKPDGVVCSAEGPKDNEGRPTVLSLFPELPQRIYPVGRLDFHTRGALILTNDGDLAAALTHPRHEIPKTYHVNSRASSRRPSSGPCPRESRSRTGPSPARRPRSASSRTPRPTVGCRSRCGRA
ncbi:pseudouridine synthase [Nannocystis pusilla]|uniref:pseudouridine synthase n=1 Tax=Nannocystis pusilla TaxID=889268 RepID=UPI003B8261E6